MSKKGQHGGKRIGAGRKPKWDFLFKLKVGQECERLFREASKKAFETRRDKLFREFSDVADQVAIATSVPKSDRRRWLESEEGELHQSDMSAELETLNSGFPENEASNRVFTISTRPSYGTRPRIIAQVAASHSLTKKQVDNIWQAYRRFERQ